MASEYAERFMDALKQAEETGDLGPLLSVFAVDADLANLSGGPKRGPDGVKAFWQAYLAVFPRVRSKFTRVTERDGLNNSPPRGK